MRLTRTAVAEDLADFGLSFDGTAFVVVDSEPMIDELRKAASRDALYDDNFAMCRAIDRLVDAEHLGDAAVITQARIDLVTTALAEHRAMVANWMVWKVARRFCDALTKVLALLADDPVEQRGRWLAEEWATPTTQAERDWFARARELAPEIE